MFQMDMSAYSAHNTGSSHTQTVASAERTVVNIPTAMNVSYTGKVASIPVTFNWDRKTMLLLLPLHRVIHSLRRSVVKPIWSTLTRIRWHSPVASSVMMKTHNNHNVVEARALSRWLSLWERPMGSAGQRESLPATSTQVDFNLNGPTTTASEGEISELAPNGCDNR
jgi:hypothetical protein